jgi:hypothetical protein
MNRMEQTEKPSAQERRAAIQQGQKKKRLRGFLIGLLAGQLLIILLDLGGKALLYLLRDRIRSNSPVPLEALVFIGMASGILITALLIFAVLGMQGLGWAFGKKKVGFFAAAGRGAKRVFQAAGALGLTLGVIGGTAWFMIPARDWVPTVEYLDQQKHKVEMKAKGGIDDLRDKK